MTVPTDKELRELLKQASSAAPQTVLRRDLWPDMLRRLDRDPGLVRDSANIPWFDWVLAALLGAALFLFHGAIPALLYHL